MTHIQKTKKTKRMRKDKPVRSATQLKPAKPAAPESLPDKIVRAALTLLENKPIHNLTYREIAAQAGVSHMAPYRYFKTIEDIFFRINEDGDRMLRKSIQGVIDEFPLDPERQLREAGIRYFDFAIENPARFTIMTSERIGEKNKEAWQRLLEIRRETLAVFIQLIRNCQLKGILPAKNNSEELALILWSLMLGVVTLYSQGQPELLKSPLNSKHIITIGTQAFIRGMSQS